MALERKVIKRGSFCSLEGGLCRLLLLRHGEHQRGILTEAGQAHLNMLASQLKVEGIELVAAFSSSSAKALSSVIRVMAELIKFREVTTDLRLGSLTTILPDMARQISHDAAAAGIGFQEQLLNKCRTDSGSSVDIEGLGKETAAALHELATRYQSRTILIGSHGGCRIEPAVISLMKADFEGWLHKDTWLVGLGGMVELIYRPSDEEVVEVCQLIHPTDTKA
ncbi:hypothetical protein KKG41_01875 [Patescibacteria group bacterium]|nr:hypothetical protein [Patescibacteria group bacterium]MBU1890369.1 hypothetical protein [Patescibacteria group bacterium]